MRLYEIEHNTLLDIIDHYFQIDNDRISVNKNNKINVYGEVNARNTVAFPNNEIPIQFDKVSVSFTVDDMKLISLKHSPRFIGKHFNCSFNNLTSLEYGPEIVMGNYICGRNPLKTLNGLSKQIGGRLIISYHVDLPLLKILLVNDLKKVSFRGSITTDASSTAEELINKYLGQGRRGAIQCAAELSKANLKGNARL